MTVTVQDFTAEDTNGAGIFDVMMRGAKVHVEAEYNQGRLKGPEYSAVYLGMLNTVMDKAMELLLNKDKTALELLLLQAQIDKVHAEILLVQAQVCLAEAQFDLVQQQIPKVAAEIALLTQKTVTEKAQTSSVGVDPLSVIGKQLTLYTNQADGYIRDGEQKVADKMIQTWNVRRTTDEATLPSTAGLADDNILRAVNKMLAGVGA